MKKLKRYLYIFITLFVIFPCLTNAATELTASTQYPVVGSNLYVQLDVNYSEKYQIGDLHLVIDYDTSYLKLEEVIWIQAPGTYKTSPGKIYIDKEYGRNWRVGASMQFKFTVLKDGLTEVNVDAARDKNGAPIPSHYSDKNVIGQSFAPISINPTKPSTFTTIGSLYIKGYTLQPTFSKTHYSYNLTVPSDVTQVEVVGTKGDSKQTITGLGKRKLEYGINRIHVVVKAQNGASRTYEITVHRTDNRTGDTSLQSISISNTNLRYEKGKTTYEATVSRSVDNVLITARTTDTNATLIGTGKKNLNMGKNVFKLDVTSSGGAKTTYTIIINRSTEELQTVTKSSKLLSLKVNNLVLDLSNNKRKWLYGINKEISELSINAIAESQTATIDIIGNKKLKEGINVITIKVTETTKEVTEYTLIVYKNPKDAKIINDLNNITDNSNLVYTTTLDANHLLKKDILNPLINNKQKLYYNVVNIYNGILYQAVFKNSIDENIDVDFKKISDRPLTYQTNIGAETDMLLYLEEQFFDDTNVKIYTYDKMGKYTLLTEGVKVLNGYITFTTNGEKNYVITTSTLINEKGPLDKFLSKYKMYIIGPIIGLILILTLINYFSKKKAEKEKNEPLY